MCDVLIAEDDAAALHLTLKALKMVDGRIRTHVARDGAQALAFIRRQPPFCDAPRPQLIVLDWNLPKVHGREVPVAVRSSAATRDIPIVVVTTSDAEKDREEAAHLGVNEYFVKAPHFRDFVDSMRRITERYIDGDADS
ncbi:MAG: response regulator [Gammaproteobacteria bacterium]|nr:response regulator [Gammaproteobacteria bacterium]